jgi:hypothetical protein
MAAKEYDPALIKEFQRFCQSKTFIQVIFHINS